MGKKLKIAFISFYSGTVERGAEVFVQELARRLSKNHKVTVFQQGDGKGAGQYETVRIPVNVDWDRKDMSETLPRRLFVDYWSRKIGEMSLKTIPAVWKGRFDVVIPIDGGWQPALLRTLTWFSGGKMVISGQSGLGWDDRNNLWSFPNSFVSLTDYQKEWAKKANPMVRIDKIPNGVDLNKFRQEGDKIDFGLPKPIILYVGALIDWKRQELAIKAVSGLKKGSLVLVGEGPDKSDLQKLGDRLLSGRFDITSFPHKEMPKVYRSADLFTYPTSDSESFGIAIIEAMASGLPVVATNDPIRREIVGKAGILVNPTLSEVYSNALRKTLKKDWQDFPQKQAEKFSWDKIGKEYEKLFIELTQ